MNQKKKVTIFKILILILVVAIFAIATINFFPVIKNLTTYEGRIEFKNRIQNTGFLGMMLLFGLQVAQMFLFIIPGEPIEILAGMCYGGFWGTVFILISSAIISMAIFFLVRVLGRKFVYAFSDEKKVKKIENNKLFQDSKKVEIVMMLLFLMPGTPKDLLVYIAGLLPIKPWRFIIISTLARIPSVVSSTYAGAKLLDGNVKTALLIYGIIIVAVLVILFTFRMFDKNKVTDEAFKTIK